MRFRLRDAGRGDHGSSGTLQASGAAFEVLKAFGIGYLLYMAYSTWRDTGMLTMDNGDQGLPRRKVIVNAVLANLPIRSSRSTPSHFSRSS